MSQSTAHTGPSGLVRATPIRQPQNPELDAALGRIREIANRPTPGPVPESIRFSIETAKGLADAAPELYEMSAGAAGRFHLIATFLGTALDEIDERTQR